MEISDRLQPIGGVLIVDSNNKVDRNRNQQYLTDHTFADYLAGAMDSLGIVAFANPDAAQSMPASLVRIHMVKRDGSTQPRMIAQIGSQQVKVDYPPMTFYWHNGPDTAWNPIALNASFAQFVTQVKSTYRQVTGEQWPIQATGGFVATAWESSKGVWVYVENPMPDSLVIHAARKGSVTVKVRGLNKIPAVVDLCGYEPDPRRLADSLVSRTNEFVTFSLDWPKGDARLFYIDFTPTPLAIRASIMPPVTASVPRVAQHGRDVIVTFTGSAARTLRVWSINGRLVYRNDGDGPATVRVPLRGLGTAPYLLRASSGNSVATRLLVAGE